MACAAGPNIITNNIILAIDIANPKTSLSGSKQDLVNNLSLTEVNGVQVSNSNLGEWTFDGIDDYVTLGNPSVLNVTQEETIIAWVNPSTVDVSYRSRIGNRHGGFLTCADSKFGYEGVNSSSVWNNNIYTPSGTLKSNEWQCIAFTFKADDRVDLYYNGNQLTGKSVAGSQASASHEFRIGTESGGGWGSPPYFSGSIGIILSYDRSLTATEIQQNFNALRRRYNI